MSPSLVQRFLIRLANREKLEPKDTPVVSSGLGEKARAFGASVKNVRISESAIEFDLFSEDEISREKALGVLTNGFGEILTIRNLFEEPVSQSKEEIVRTARTMFNDQRFWECHETLEQVWRGQAKGSEKDVQQGIILAASAFVHSQKDEVEVCLGMIPRTIAKLDNWNEKEYLSIDIKRLKDSLKEISRSKRIEYPKI